MMKRMLPMIVFLILCLRFPRQSNFFNIVRISSA